MCTRRIETVHPGVAQTSMDLYAVRHNLRHSTLSYAHYSTCALSFVKKEKKKKITFNANIFNSGYVGSNDSTHICISRLTFITSAVELCLSITKPAKHGHPRSLDVTETYGRHRESQQLIAFDVPRTGELLSR